VATVEQRALTGKTNGQQNGTADSRESRSPVLLPVGSSRMCPFPNRSLSPRGAEAYGVTFGCGPPFNSQ
jgi:hypothetical protein